MSDFKPQIPPALVAFMKKPPLGREESPKEYFEFLDEVIAATQPEDAIDWIWTLRFTNSSWYALRLTRLRTALLNGRYKVALHGVIRQTKLPVAGTVQRGVSERSEREAEQEVEQWLADPSQFAKHQVDPDLVPARALIQIAEHIEKFDRMIERAERNRDRIVQQLE